jgi:hypothetical protein
MKQFVGVVFCVDEKTNKDYLAIYYTNSATKPSERYFDEKINRVIFKSMLEKLGLVVNEETVLIDINQYAAIKNELYVKSMVLEEQAKQQAVSTKTL